MSCPSFDIFDPYNRQIIILRSLSSSLRRTQWSPEPRWLLSYTKRSNSSVSFVPLLSLLLLTNSLQNIHTTQFPTNCICRAFHNWLNLCILLTTYGVQVDNTEGTYEHTRSHRILLYPLPLTIPVDKAACSGHLETKRHSQPPSSVRAKVERRCKHQYLTGFTSTYTRNTTFISLDKI